MSATGSRRVGRLSMLLRLSLDVFAAGMFGGAVGAVVVMVGFSLAHRTASDAVLMTTVAVCSVVAGSPWVRGRKARIRTRLVLLAVAVVLAVWIDATRASSHTSALTRPASGEVTR